MTNTETTGLILSFAGTRPRIADTAWVAPTAVIVGAVTLADHANIWYGTTIRTESETIHIGTGTNIQDGCVLHADPGFPVTIGDNVTVGHGAVVHGCSIGSGSLIGMGAVLMNGVTVGAGTLVAAGTVIPEGTVVPAGSLIAGVPGKVKRQLDSDHSENARTYVELARRHRAALRDPS